MTSPDWIRAEAARGAPALSGQSSPELPLFPTMTAPAGVADSAEDAPKDEPMEAVAEPSSDELSDVPF